MSWGITWLATGVATVVLHSAALVGFWRVAQRCKLKTDFWWWVVAALGAGLTHRLLELTVQWLHPAQPIENRLLGLGLDLSGLLTSALLLAAALVAYHAACPRR